MKHSTISIIASKVSEGVNHLLNLLLLEDAMLAGLRRTEKVQFIDSKLETLGEHSYFCTDGGVLDRDLADSSMTDQGTG